MGCGVSNWGGALCVEIGFYADISWESRCNNKILLVIEVPYRPRVKRMPGIYVPVGWQIYARHGKASGRTFFSDKPTVVYNRRE